MAQTIFERATDPGQYDLPEVNWLGEGSAESPMRRFLLSQLRPVLGNLAGKKTLDVGCGTGWLVAECQNLRATYAVGIDPSVRNTEMSLDQHPTLDIRNISLQDFPEEAQFDLITAVMVLEHMPDLYQTFVKLRKLATQIGRIVAVVADANYFLKARGGYTIRKENFDQVTVATEITRPHMGTVCEIIRPLQHYTDAATRAGLFQALVKPLVPNEQLTADAPRFKVSSDDAIMHLLSFKVPQWEGH